MVGFVLCGGFDVFVGLWVGGGLLLVVVFFEGCVV